MSLRTSETVLTASSRSATVGPLHALPHEWAFGAFLLALLLRLVVAGQTTSVYVPLVIGLLIGAAALAVWTSRRPTRLRWTLRLLWYPVIMGISFYLLGAVIPLLGVTNANARLAAWDHALLGQPAAQWFAAVQSPWLTDVMTVAYLSFFVYLVLGPAHYALRDMSRFRACIAGMFTVYAIGFTGYIVFPAQDPLYTVVYGSALPQSGFSTPILMGVSGAGNGFDVFPSIHVAITAFLLGFDFVHFRRRGRWLLLPCAALCASTLYLRYHYFVDVLAGLAAAAVGLLTAREYQRSALAQAVDRAAREAGCAITFPSRVAGVPGAGVWRAPAPGVGSSRAGCPRD